MDLTETKQSETNNNKSLNSSLELTCKEQLTENPNNSLTGDRRPVIMGTDSLSLNLSVNEADHHKKINKSPKSFSASSRSSSNSPNSNSIKNQNEDE